MGCIITQFLDGIYDVEILNFITPEKSFSVVFDHRIFSDLDKERVLWKVCMKRKVPVLAFPHD